MEKKRTVSSAEKRRLRQFVVCLVLFGLIFAGRGLDLAPVERVTATISRWVGADTDFREVFARMGESFSRGEPAAETFHALWTGLLPDTGSAEEADPEDGGTEAGLPDEAAA